MQYTVEVDPTVKYVVVEAEPSDAKATILSGTGSTILDADPTVVAVKVKAQDGTRRTYTVQVFRGLTPKDPTLENIVINNGGFESGTGGLGTGYLPDGWKKGGTWAGGWEWAPAVVTGSRAAWSSFNTGGINNGFSQELGTKAQAGTYYLTAWAGGDNSAGLVSRIILGYGSGTSTELAHNDLSIANGPWIKQTLKVVVAAGSAAIGKPLWIRLTGVAKATGNGGDSNWWDDVNLHYSTDTNRVPDEDATLGYVEIAIDRSDDTGICDSLTLTPAFDPQVTDYTVQSPPATLGYLRVQGFPTTWMATLTGAGYRALGAGQNTIALTVTSESGNIRTYRFQINLTKVVLKVLDNASAQFRYNDFSSWFPGIDIQFEGASDLTSTVYNKMKAGTLPDIWAHPAVRKTSPALAQAKDLTALMGKSWVDRFEPTAVAAGTQNTMVKAVPTNLALVGIAYTNGTLVTAPPTTYAEAKALAASLNAQGKKAYLIGGSDRWMLQSPYFSTLMGRLLGASFIEGVYAGTRHFTDADFVNALTVFKQTITDKVLDPASLNLNYDGAQTAFRNGESGFQINGSWAVSAFLAGRGNGVEIPVADQANYSLNGLPPFAATEANPGAIAGVWDTGYAVNSAIAGGSDQEKAAVKFLKYMYSTATGQKILEDGDSIPTWVAELDVSKAQPLVRKMKVFKDAVLPKLCPIFDASFGEPLVTSMNNALYELALGTKTAAQSAQAVEDAWKTMAP